MKRKEDDVSEQDLALSGPSPVFFYPRELRMAFMFLNGKNPKGEYHPWPVEVIGNQSWLERGHSHMPTCC